MTYPPADALDDGPPALLLLLLLLLRRARVSLQPAVVGVGQPLDQAEAQPPPRLGLALRVCRC